MRSPSTYVNLVCSVPKLPKPWLELPFSALCNRGLPGSQSHGERGGEDIVPVFEVLTRKNSLKSLKTPTSVLHCVAFREREFRKMDAGGPSNPL